MKYRLEVFKTPKCGWAVRTWDLIPMGVFVTMFVGEIWPHKELMEEHAADRREDTYFFDMGKRTDYDDEGVYIGYTGYVALYKQILVHWSLAYAWLLIALCLMGIMGSLPSGLVFPSMDLSIALDLLQEIRPFIYTIRSHWLLAALLF